MADMKTGDAKNYPLNPDITIVMRSQPEHNNFSRYLTFENYKGNFKRLKVKFKKKSGLTWEVDSFPNGTGSLRSMVDLGNRSYWDKIYLENRGGSTLLPIKNLKIVMNYENPSGSSPHGSNHVVNGLDLSLINYAKIPIVDWDINMDLLAGYDKIDLGEFRKRTLYKWAGIDNDDPAYVRDAIADCGKSGSDGSDQYGLNPKFGGEIRLLCSEFVTWYYHEHNIKVNGKSLRDIIGAQQLHDLFKAEGKLYRYNSGNSLQDFVKNGTKIKYTPKPGDYLERRGPDGAEHSMIMYRWLPKDTSASKTDDRSHQALVINGPWPVTLRLVKIHKDERTTGDGFPKDYFLGRID